MASYLFNNNNNIDETILKQCNFDARLLKATLLAPSDRQNE